MFELSAPYQPAGDQPQAIAKLTEGVLAGREQQTLVGVTGSGKTFTIANVIQAAQKPTLVISHNKTLAAQLYAEFKSFFPSNAVEYFVSYFDYYQPEAYIPRTDTFIEKDSSINEEIERLRLSTMSSVADPPRRHRRGQRLLHLWHRQQGGLRGAHPANPRRHGAFPATYCSAASWICNTPAMTSLSSAANSASAATWWNCAPSGSEDGLRIEFFGEEIERITRFEPLTGKRTETLAAVIIFPAKQFVTPGDKIKRALLAIREEMGDRIAWFEARGKLLEAQRIKMRTEYDLEMMEEMGFCSGIENYSRHLGGPPAGFAPGHAAGFFPDGLSAGRGRIPRHRPANRRHVRRGQLAQNRAGGARLSPAQRAGQPAPAIPGISIAPRSDHLRQRHPRPSRKSSGPRAASSNKSSAPPV